MNLNIPAYSVEDIERARARAAEYEEKIASFKGRLRLGGISTPAFLLDAVNAYEMCGIQYRILRRYDLMRERLLKAIEIAQKGSRKCRDKMKPVQAGELMTAVRNCLFNLAPFSFHHFMIAMEWEYDETRKFYSDRISVIGEWAEAMNDLEYGKYDLLGISAPPRTGKSGCETYFLAWLMGRHPDKSILFATHTNQMATKIMEDVLSLISEPKRHYADIFPDLKVDKSAEYNWIDLSPKEYPNNYKTIYFRGIDSAFAGVLEASWMIVCDDLIRSIEEAMNPSRLETAWTKYGTDISQRRTSDSVKELHIATRWSVNDVLTRLQELNRDNPRAKFIVKPGLNEYGESNFMYKYHPMTKEHFERLREHMDEVSFECIVQQNPMEREGILFPRDSLCYYEGVLPDGEPDEVVFAADIAFGGGDFLSMPIAYVYGWDVYIHDVVHSNGAKETTKPMVVHAIIENGVQRGFMEANAGGSDYAADIDERLKKAGYRCHIETKFAPNTKSKLTRILDCESEIKGRITDGTGYRFFFLSRHARAGKPMYELYMKHLCKFNQTARFQGKQLDDAADATSSLVYNVLNRRKVSNILQTVSRRYLGL